MSLLFCTFSVLACLYSSRNALYGLLIKITILPRRKFERLFDLDLALGGGDITNGNETRKIQGVFYVKRFHKLMKYIFIILILHILNGVKSCLQLILTLYLNIHGGFF